VEKFTRLSSMACPLAIENIDTDQLIPARFMKRPRSQGYGGFLLHDLRFFADGSPAEGFPLGNSRYAGGRILVARRNFGTGSSREAAVYALWDYGIRCVIAPSFGDIFLSNAVKNGLLPAIVAPADCERLLALAASADAGEMTVDLKARTILAAGSTFPFGIAEMHRLQLLNGWDDIDLTLRHAADIARFRDGHRASAPWNWPVPVADRRPPP
jgi:3-isopropylmalate/(R)-2-methylmalate dehydratase small subunit